MILYNNDSLQVQKSVLVRFWTTFDKSQLSTVSIYKLVFESVPKINTIVVN